MLDPGHISHLTFDCYGTLIDWESGILRVLRNLVQRHGTQVEDARLLQLYAECEAEREAGAYRPYHEILRLVTSDIALRLGFRVDESDLDTLSRSIDGWTPFADTVEALRRLQRRYKLVILSNIDDALFAGSARQLGVEFDDVITAEQVGSYKPALENFRFALRRLGIPTERLLHVAQSIFHDHVPAKRLGLATAWVNRPSRLLTTGLSLPADATPDLEVPDLQSLVRALSRG
jgi:2-haloacid dehalogenase